MTSTLSPAAAFTGSSDGARSEVERFMQDVVRRDPDQPEFHQAVREVAESVMPLVLDTQRYRDARILERMSEPDRVVSFRVMWEDDGGEWHMNRAWRVQFNGAIGPYKGGMRFHPSVTLSVLKFLGFEQTFKNLGKKSGPQAADHMPPASAQVGESSVHNRLEHLLPRIRLPHDHESHRRSHQRGRLRRGVDDPPRRRRLRASG